MSPKQSRVCFDICLFSTLNFHCIGNFFPFLFSSPPSPPPSYPPPSLPPPLPSFLPFPLSFYLPLLLLFPLLFPPSPFLPTLLPFFFSFLPSIFFLSLLFLWAVIFSFSEQDYRHIIITSIIHNEKPIKQILYKLIKQAVHLHYSLCDSYFTSLWPFLTLN